MPDTIAKSYRVQILRSGDIGVIDSERTVNGLASYRVIDYDNKVELGWFNEFELKPYERQPGDVPEHIVKAGRRGAALLGKGTT